MLTTKKQSSKTRSRRNSKTRTRKGRSRSRSKVGISIGSIKIQEILQEINDKIQKKCPKMKLVLDSRENLTGEIHTFNETPNPEDVILCLYKGENCISSITFGIFEQKLTISSRTARKEEHRKYNTFLRMCAILFIHAWGYKSVTSLAENPTTVWLFMKYFYPDHMTFDDAEFRESSAFPNENMDFTKENVKKGFMSSITRYLRQASTSYSNGYIVIQLEINDTVLGIAKNNIETLLSETGIQCE